MTKSKSSVYPRVRALERGFELVNVLSEIGWATPGQLAKQTGINRATVYRLLHTLEINGYVHCRLGDGSYFLTNQFISIADGIKDEDWIAQIIGPHLGHLLGQVRWPSDFAVFTGGAMVIRESTHRYSPMSINRAMVGKARPLMHSSLGIAFLSAVSDGAKQKVLQLATLSPKKKFAPPLGEKELMRRIRYARMRGYAESIGGTEPKISAIGLPVSWRDYVLGAINIMFFTGAMTPQDAAQKYLSPLQECVSSIEDELNKLCLGEHTGWLKRKELQQ